MYHPSNLAHQPYAPWRVKFLAFIGWALGIQFKIVGIPYGATYDKQLWESFWAKENGNSGLST